MTDTRIKGSGNSRTLKTVPNIKALVSDLDDLLDLLIDGFPVDLLGPNPEGCEVIGNNLDKEALLRDDTEIHIWGNAGNRKPNQAFHQLRSQIITAQNTANGRVQSVSGSYKGTGGEAVSGYYQKVLSFPFPPKVIILGIPTYLIALFSYPSATSLDDQTYSVIWSGSTVTLRSSRDNGDSVNNEAFTYYYFAIG